MHRATLLHARGPIGRFAAHLLLLLTLLLGLPGSFAHAAFVQASAASGIPIAGATRIAGTHAARPAPPYRITVRPHGLQLARFALRPWGAAVWTTPRPLGHHARSASHATSDGVAGGKKPAPVGTTFPLAPQPGGASLPPPFVQGVQPALSGPLGSYNPGPYEMAAGSDRRLWFTEYGGNAIGAVAPSTNIVTTYSLPNVGSNPVGIAAGPDLALWFTEYGGTRIGRITTAGLITEYPIPTAGAQAYGIALGADGNLWFTE